MPISVDDFKFKLAGSVSKARFDNVRADLGRALLDARTKTPRIASARRRNARVSEEAALSGQLPAVDLLATTDRKEAHRIAAGFLVDARALVARVDDDVAVTLPFVTRRDVVTSALERAERLRDAEYVRDVLAVGRARLTEAQDLVDDDATEDAIGVLGHAESKADEAAQLLAFRARMLTLLGDTLQSIHRKANQYGGLRTLRTVPNGDFPKEWRVDVSALNKLWTDRDDLAQQVRASVVAARDQVAFERKVRALHAKVGAEVDAEVTSYRDESVKAVRACDLGKEAEDAIAGMMDEWRAMKVTDAPNPYYDDEEGFALAGLTGELGELFKPKHRYIHVEGDQYVNASKTAAIQAARTQVPEVILDDIVADIRSKDGGKRRAKVVRERRDGLVERITGGRMMEWYKTSGADILARNGLAGKAANWRKGEVDFEDVGDHVVQEVNEAAQRHLAGLHIDEEVDRAIDAEVEEGILSDARQRKGRQQEEQQMAPGDYWVELGRRAKNAEYGRCFTCAGVAVHSLVMNPAFDRLTIESVGAVGYDHHFVLVGRTGGEVGSATPPAMDSKALVIDVWQANQGGTPPATTWADFTYNKETELKVFSVMRPQDRAALRKRCMEYAEE
jgi:hypothetical protein